MLQIDFLTNRLHEKAETVRKAETREMADEKSEKKQKAQPAAGQGKPQGKKAKAEQAEAAAADPHGKPARPKATSRDTARLRDRYYKEVRPALMKEFNLANPDGCSQAGEDHGEHGRGRGNAECEADRSGSHRGRPDHRAEAGDHQGAQVDRSVQGARGKCPSA